MSKKNSKKSNKDIKETNKNNKNNENNISDKIGWTVKEEKPRNIYSELEYKLEPIKILYKYKNNNRKSQYLTYIFLGDIGKRYDPILKKIEKLNLYDSLLILSRDEENKLMKAFGELWMTKFFNIYHISAFVNKLEKKADMKKELLKKYEKEWIDNFISKFKNEVVFKKINYSYSDLIKFQYKVKMGKKLEKVMLEKEDIEDISFETKDKSGKNVNILYEVKDLLKGGSFNTQKGGEFEEAESFDEPLDDFDEVPTEDEFDVEEEYQEKKEGVDEETEEDVGSVISSEPEEVEMDFEEIEKIYQMEDVDKNVVNTGTMISNIIENNKIIEKKDNYMIKFDDSQDEDIDNQDLSQVYEKKYVYSHYIFKDD